MTALQKTLVVGAVAVLAGGGVYQVHEAAKLRDQVQKLQQQQASLNDQIRQLKQEHQETQHQLVDLREKPKVEVRVGTYTTPSFASPAALPSDMLESELERAYSETTPGRREIALKNIGQSISPTDIPRALAFLASRPGTNGVNSPLFPDLASKWGNSDPGAASAWANSLTDPEARKEALVGVLKGWTDKSPEAAAAYAATLSPQDVQEAAILKVVGEWAFWGHADGAANWVAQFPAGEVRDKAMGTVVFWGSGQCPATIADMLDTTGDPEVIKKYGETVAAVWLNRDKPAATVWIEKSPLPDDVKQRLLNSNQ